MLEEYYVYYMKLSIFLLMSISIKVLNYVLFQPHIEYCCDLWTTEKHIQEQYTCLYCKKIIRTPTYSGTFIAWSIQMNYLLILKLKEVINLKSCLFLLALRINCHANIDSYSSFKGYLKSQFSHLFFCIYIYIFCHALVISSLFTFQP